MISCKSCITWLVAAFLIVMTRSRNRAPHQRLIPPARALITLIAAAAIAQLFGGVLMQRAFAIIGIALVVPLYIGSMMCAAAAFGAWLLGERVSARLVTALIVLLIAVVTLCLGGQQANASLQTADNLIMAGASVVDGVLSAITVGIAYAFLSVIVRYVMTRHKISQYSPVLIVSSVGIIVIGSWAITRGALTTLPTIGVVNAGWILAGGLCNGIAFTCLAAALNRLAAAYVNAINASQAALGLLAGVFFFAEPPSASLLVGLTIMLAGFALLGRAQTSAT